MAPPGAAAPEAHPLACGLWRRRSLIRSPTSSASSSGISTSASSLSPSCSDRLFGRKTAVRDLLDSMYRGFPVGYLMLWNAAEVDRRFIGTDGKQHTPTEFIIDGQQRLTSLYAVMKGAEVTFKDFSGPNQARLSAARRTI